MIRRGFIKIGQVLVVALFAVLVSRPATAAITVTKVDIGLPNTVLLKIDGDFDGNEVLKFKAAIADVPANVRIIVALNSGGGLVAQGLGLGDFFYEAKIVTVVLGGQSCASACTLAFFGGRDPLTRKPLRIMTTGAKLGFHNTRTIVHDKLTYSKKELEELSHTLQKLVYIKLKYFERIEVPMEAVVPALSTPAADMYWLPENDALDIGISVLNQETGQLIKPDQMARRTR